MPTILCPICDGSFDAELSSALPFCSDRCRNIDLGRWVDEEYGMSIEREHDLYDDGQ